MNHLLLQQRNEGFFSDFNLITSSLLYFYKQNITTFNVLWNNKRYQNDNSNLFTKYFFDLPDLKKYDITHDVEEFSSIWKPVMETPTFIELNNTLKSFNYFNNICFKQAKKIAETLIKEKFLGVHIRGTDSTQHRHYISIETYFPFIEEKIKQNNYKGLFVATDEESILEKLIQRYSSKAVTYNKNIIRSTDGSPIHGHLNRSDEEKEKIAFDVILDGVCLSMCEELIHTASNVIGYTLSVNPHLKREQIDKNNSHF